MENTEVTIPGPILRRARLKAQKEDVAVDQVVSDLLTRWVDGEIRLPARVRSRQELTALIRAARGMWADRGPDRYLAVSRASLRTRDQELENARLDA